MRTSFIQEDELTGGQGPNGIPFLAGQDWLVMMRAVIDIERNRLRLPLIDVEVGIYVDTSGHLVIAIDEFPPGGWPSGLTTKVDQYAGAIFLTNSRQQDAGEGEPDKAAQQKACDDGQGTNFPNFNYEPNHNTLNNDIPQGPCHVQPDHWEFQLDKGIVIRHHRRPRTFLFGPNEAYDRPDPEILLGERVTIRAGDEPSLDDWRVEGRGLSRDEVAWTGLTCFFTREFPVGSATFTIVRG